MAVGEATYYPEMTKVWFNAGVGFFRSEKLESFSGTPILDIMNCFGNLVP